MADYSGLIRDVVRFQEAAFSGTGLDGTLPPGATEEELALAEEDLGFGLPGELKALYRFCRGGLPLGAHYWLPITELAEQTRDVSDDLDDHYDYLEPLPPLEEGPKGHKFVCINTHQRTIVVEADKGSRVWEYHVHSPDSPFILGAGSLGEYWSILAALAESGWYRASDQLGVSVVEPYIDLVDEAGHTNPAYVADLEGLGLSQRDFYL